MAYGDMLRRYLGGKQEKSLANAEYVRIADAFDMMKQHALKYRKGGGSTRLPLDNGQWLEVDWEMGPDARRRLPWTAARKVQDALRELLDACAASSTKTDLDKAVEKATASWREAEEKLR